MTKGELGIVEKSTLVLKSPLLSLSFRKMMPMIAPSVVSDINWMRLLKLSALCTLQGDNPYCSLTRVRQSTNKSQAERPSQTPYLYFGIHFTLFPAKGFSPFLFFLRPRAIISPDFTIEFTCSATAIPFGLI